MVQKNTHTHTHTKEGRVRENNKANVENWGIKWNNMWILIIFSINLNLFLKTSD